MICNICPRQCNAPRTDRVGGGYCRMGNLPVVARVAPHFGEEPCISGSKGSGTVFFSGCTLGCVYCQNFDISQKNKGRMITPAELADCYRKLEQQGVHNINLVTADHFAVSVAKSFEIYKPRIPIVYNCSGYLSHKILNLLDGIVDVYLPDFKYSSNVLAEKYSDVPNYVETAIASIKGMLFQVGLPEFDNDGIMKKGVLVRHMVLPGHTRNSIGVLDILKDKFDGQIMLSLMGQYTPLGKAYQYDRLNRTITKREYEKVKQVYMIKGFEGFTQGLSSADEQYVPEWDF